MTKVMLLAVGYNNEPRTELDIKSRTYARTFKPKFTRTVRVAVAVDALKLAPWAVAACWT